MKLIDRYLAKEILLPFGAGLLFLTQLLVVTQMLADASVLIGSLRSAFDVLVLFVLLMPSFLGQVLPIAFLMGSIVGVGRLAQDRELVALSAAGVSPLRLLVVPVSLAVVVAAFGLLLSAEVEPAALDAARERLLTIVKRNVQNDVKAGTFYDQIGGYTLYAERVRPDGTWKNVLVSDHSYFGDGILILSKGARLVPDGVGEAMRLVFEDGEAYRDDVSGNDDAIFDFERGQVAIDIDSVFSKRSGLVRADRNRPSALFAEAQAARAKGDESWALHQEALANRKISAPLVVLPFALLAVPLAIGRRSGWAFGVAAAFLAMVAHYVMLRGCEVLARKGGVPPAFALQIPNLVLGGIGLALVFWQVRRGAAPVR